MTMTIIYMIRQLLNVAAVSKDLEISDLKHYIKDLEAKNDDLKNKKLKEIPASTTAAAMSGPERKKMHNPPKRPCVELADYYELAEGEEPRNCFVCLAPGTSIAVSSLWLQKLLASIPKKKSKKNIKSPQRPLGFDIIKRLIDEFYEPWHLNVGGGTAGFRDTPVFKSLRRYAEHKLKYEPEYLQQGMAGKDVFSQKHNKKTRR